MQIKFHLFVFLDLAPLSGDGATYHAKLEIDKRSTQFGIYYAKLLQLGILIHLFGINHFHWDRLCYFAGPNFI